MQSGRLWETAKPKKNVYTSLSMWDLDDVKLDQIAIALQRKETKPFSIQVVRKIKQWAVWCKRWVAWIIVTWVTISSTCNMVHDQRLPRKWTQIAWMSHYIYQKFNAIYCHYIWQMLVRVGTDQGAAGNSLQLQTLFEENQLHLCWKEQHSRTMLKMKLESKNWVRITPAGEV